ncbi:C22orf39 isoform 1 [Pan troglodytes]|uniref:Synaptic plasticity regulator PANTS n=1 Tax=Pan troglodytes TaxID=9598 RepID=A0A2J8Q270_PANTR|nr:C22orf39 isoform 1 [Pan troglodytes]
MADGSSWQPPRPCEAYRAEWKLCRSARHFLHHYYVHGERPACEQWQRDLASCRDWEERRSAEAQASRFFQLIFTLTGPSSQLEDKGRILGRL